MALTGGQFGELNSVKWYKNRTTGKWDVVLFDEQAGGDQLFSGDTLDEAFDAAQAWVEPYFPNVQVCFSGAVIYVED